MKNNIYFKISSIFILFILLALKANADQFDFKVKEIEILENGNLYKGSNRGIIETDNGITIEADNFVYNKISNILNASGQVKIDDKLNKYKIFSDKITYKKNEEIIFTNGNSRALDNNKKIINAEDFTYNKVLDTLNAKKKSGVRGWYK